MQVYVLLGLIAWGIISPFASFGAADLRAKWVTIPNERAKAAREATDKEHKRGEAACNDRVEGIRQKLADANEEARKLAEEAANTIGPTPAEKTALQSVCNASSSCRDRQQGVKP